MAKGKKKGKGKIKVKTTYKTGDGSPATGQNLSTTKTIGK